MDSSVSGTIESTTPPPRLPILEPNIYFTTFLGLFIAFSSYLYGREALQSLGEWIGMSQYASWMLATSADKIVCTAILLGIVIFVERRSICSVGLVRLTRLDLGLGLVLFATIVILDRGFSLLLYKMFPGFMAGVASDQTKVMENVPVAFILFGEVVNGFFEEIAARGYAIDRLQAATGSLLLASSIALVLDLAIHVRFWGWKYPILIFPSQTLFVLMYVWRRNISACIIAHIAVNSVYVVLSVGGIATLLHFGGESTHAVLASQAFDRDDYKGAIAEYSKAIQNHPNDTKLRLHRAEAESGDRNFGAALEDLDEVLRRDPANVSAYESRALAYYATGWYDEQALADANKAVSLAPESSDPYSYRAYLFAGQKQYDKAASGLSAAIKYSRAKDADLYHRRGWIYLSMRDYDHAIADLTEAAKLNSKDARIFFNRASAYLGKKQDDRAIADLTHALQIDPKDTTAYLERATAYQNRQQFDLAFADLTRAVEASPDDSAAQNALAWMMSTCPDQKFRNGKEALTHANRACDLSSWQQGEFIDTLAAAFAELGNFSQAASWEQRAITFMKSESSEQQQDAAKRLELYKAKQPYRETHAAG